VCFFCVAAVAALSSFVFAQAAFGQEDGVFVDPDSPSAKQYSIPLERERREADPSQEPGAGVQQGARTSPLFGAGIEGVERAAPPRSSERKPRSTKRSGKPSEPQASDDRKILQAATSHPGAPGGGFEGALAIGSVAIAVLLVGGAAGVLLRRRV
jgi:hypothetical protein